MLRSRSPPALPLFLPTPIRPSWHDAIDNIWHSVTAAITTITCLGHSTPSSIILYYYVLLVVTGAKVGPYTVSNNSNVERAKVLAENSVNVVSTTMGSFAAGTVTVTAVAVTLPGVSIAAAGMPGGGAIRMIKNAHWAKLTVCCKVGWNSWI